MSGNPKSADFIAIIIPLVLELHQALDEPPLVTSDTNIYYAPQGYKKSKTNNDYVVAPSHFFKPTL